MSSIIFAARRHGSDDRRSSKPHETIGVAALCHLNTRHCEHASGRFAFLFSSQRLDLLAVESGSVKRWKARKQHLTQIITRFCHFNSDLAAGVAPRVALLPLKRRKRSQAEKSIRSLPILEPTAAFTGRFCESPSPPSGCRIRQPEGQADPLTAKFVTLLPYFGLLRGSCRERFGILSLD